jgi:hypothetical protein
LTTNASNGNLGLTKRGNICVNQDGSVGSSLNIGGPQQSMAPKNKFLAGKDKADFAPCSKAQFDGR